MNFRFIRNAIQTVRGRAQMGAGLSQLAELLPKNVYGLRTEANISIIAPWFFKALDIPGDVCEFGCFRGTLSIKFAYALKALGRDKTVYAFDTFEGFQVADPSGGALGIGAYSDNENSFDELTKWSAVLPLRPVKGDATKTAKSLSNRLSFVWLDLDFAIFMGPVLDAIWHLIEPETIIGVDDVGRPETPSIGPWVDQIVSQGRLVELERYPGDFIRFYRANKARG